MGNVVINFTGVSVATKNVRKIPSSFCVFCDLVNIESSDLETHNIVCNIFQTTGLLNFYNAGKEATKGEPATFDDARPEVAWLNKFFSVLNSIMSSNIGVSLLIDKKDMLSRGSVEIDYGRGSNKAFNLNESNELIDICIAVLRNYANIFGIEIKGKALGIIDNKTTYFNVEFDNYIRIRNKRSKK